MMNAELDNETVQCGACGWRVPPGAVCAHCGNPMDMAPPLPEDAPGEPPAPDFAPGPSPAPRSRGGDTTRRSAPPKSTASAHLAASSSPPSGGRNTPASPCIADSECGDLTLRYNIGRIFVVGGNFTLDFEVETCVEGLSDVEVSLEIARPLNEPLHMSKLVHRLPSRGRTYRRSVNFAPEMPGSVAVVIRVAYRKDGMLRRFECEQRHMVYDGSANARSVLEGQVQNLKLEIHQGHAGEIQLGDYIHHLQSSQIEEGAINKLIAMLHHLPQIMVDLPLDACFDAPPPIERITLRTASGLVHLHRQRRIGIGRHSSNEIVARHFGEDQEAAWELSGRISKFHASIHFDGEGVEVRDAGFAPGLAADTPSTWGTYIDGRRIGSGAACRVETGTRFRLSLVAGEPEEPACLGYFALVCPALPENAAVTTPAPADAKPGAILLDRGDSTPEKHLVLWRRVALGVADPALAGMEVWCQDGSFRYRMGRREDWLIPGRSLSLDNMRMEICPYQQWGMPRKTTPAGS